jgi:phosphate transport system substrate-binding protein
MKKLITAFLVGAFCLAGAVSAKEILVKGSDTMLNLVQRLAEAFGNAQSDATVSVTGGGSGVGINAIVNGDCDIGDASRSITSKEISDARSNGVEPTEFAIAIDGLSLVVNGQNTVNQLTKAQIGAIYRGEIKNWKELGGADKKITLYGRQPSSGTYVYLRDEVMKGDYASTMLQMNGNSQIVEAVKNDLSGIGYVGAGYAKGAEGINVVSVASAEGGEYVSPLDADKVNNGDYPITRPLFQYTNGAPKGDARAFIEFELGPDGQKIVQDEGFFPVNAAYQAQNESKLK